MKQIVWILLVAAVPAWSQTPPPVEEEKQTAYVRRFSLGGRLSFPVWGRIAGGDHTQHLTAGPTQIDSTNEGKSTLVGGGIALQIALSDRFALSADLLRRKVGYYLTSTTYVGTDNESTATDERTATGRKENTRASSWEMPLLVRRYNIGRFEEGPRWFWEAGGSIRRTGGVATFIEQGDDECCLQTPARLAHRYSPGLTVGFGAQLADDYGVKIVPEVRYTRWLNRPFDTLPARSRANQLEILIGVTF